MLALILGVVGLFVPGVGIAAIILGRRDPSSEAKVGVVLGWVGTVLTIVGCCATLVVVVAALPALSGFDGSAETTPAPEEPTQPTLPPVPTVWIPPKTGFLGVRCEDADGAKITEVIPESPAAQVGLREGDVIVRAADRDVYSCRDLADVVRNRPEETISLTIRRGRETVDVSVTLGSR